MAQAVIYARSSKDRSDMSIAAQRRALSDLANSRNLTLIDEYTDAVESGKDDDRPGFQRLLADLKRADRQWSTILVLDTSRIARRRYLALIMEKECERRQVEIIYKNVPDTDPVTAMLLKSILQAMDEWHSLNSRVKGLAGMAENVRAGYRAGGRAPRGYDLETHSTGAIREGRAVTKSRLKPNDDAAALRVYLQLRAKHVPRGRARTQAGLETPGSTLHSTDWQALTYAGHTVWNVHAERVKGGTGDKRRPRSQWLVQKNTHQALITDEQAESILAQCETTQAGRRRSGSPLLLSGLVETPDGRLWHSDGCGAYRLGKGKKISARRLEAAVLGRLQADLSSDQVVERLAKAVANLQRQGHDAGMVAKIEQQIAAHDRKIARLVDLAATMEQPAAVLRTVQQVDIDRKRAMEQLDAVRIQAKEAAVASITTPAAIRALLTHLFADIQAQVERGELIDARLAMSELIEKIELAPDASTVMLHYSMTTGVNVASRRRAGLTPLRWTGRRLNLAA